MSDKNHHRSLARVSLAFARGERRLFGTIMHSNPVQYPQVVKVKVQTYYIARDDWITAIKVFRKKIVLDNKEEDDDNVQDLPRNGSSGICPLVSLRVCFHAPFLVFSFLLPSSYLALDVCFPWKCFTYLFFFSYLLDKSP
jgi:hypothetical protein